MNLNKLKNLLIISTTTVLFSSSLLGCMPQQIKENTEPKKWSNFIPYIAKKNGQSDLYLMDSQGKNKLQLTDDVYEESDPTILNNGKILFASKRTGTWQLYIINPDGKNLKAITNDKGFNNYRPALAIDGTILFVSDRELKPKIFVMDPDGANLIKLTDDDNYYDYPSPLDDGSILYLSNDKSKWEIWKMNADGSNKVRITNMPSKPISLSAMPAYVKDTQVRTPGLDDSFLDRRNQSLNNFVAKAVFTARDKDGDLEIYRINIDGYDLRNLTQMPGVDANPIVLKNGKIIFTSDRDGTFDVWVMDSDGFNPTNLSIDPYYASSR